MASKGITKPLSSRPITKSKSKPSSPTNTTKRINQSFSSTSTMGVTNLLSSIKENRTTISSFFKPPSRPNKSLYSKPTNIINKAYYSKPTKTNNKSYSSKPTNVITNRTFTYIPTNEHNQKSPKPAKKTDRNVSSISTKAWNQRYCAKPTKYINKTFFLMPKKSINTFDSSSQNKFVNASYSVSKKAKIKSASPAIPASLSLSLTNVDDSSSDEYSELETFQDNQSQQVDTKSSANNGILCLKLNDKIQHPHDIAESGNNWGENNCNQSFLESNQSTTTFNSVPTLKEKSSDYKNKSELETFQDNQSQQVDTKSRANDGILCLKFNDKIQHPHDIAESGNNWGENNCNPSFLESNQNTTTFNSVPTLNEKSSDYKNKSFSFIWDSISKLVKSVSNVLMTSKIGKGVFAKCLEILFVVMIVIGILTCVIAVSIVATGGFHTSVQVGINGWPNLLSLNLGVNMDKINEKEKYCRYQHGLGLNTVQNKQQNQEGGRIIKKGKRKGNDIPKVFKQSKHKGKTTKPQKKEQVTHCVDQAQHIFKSKPQPLMSCKALPETTQELSKSLQLNASIRTTIESIKNTFLNLILSEDIKGSSWIKLDQVGSVLPKGNHIRWPEHFTSLHDSPAVQVAEILTLRASHVVLDAVGQLSLTVLHYLPNAS